MKHFGSSPFLALVIISALTLACTLPFYMGSQEAQETVIYIEVTSTPEESPTEEPDEEETEDAPEVTPTVSVSLDGSWTIWLGTDEKELDLDFLQNGYEVTANVVTGGDDSTLFTGVISQDGESVSGTWESTDGTSGNFAMYLNDDFSSFSGNLGGGVPFCGVRGTGEKPSPCLE